MMKNITYTTSSVEETKQKGKDLARALSPGTVIALSGDLGAGKTTFVQGLAQGLGITKRIISPSFVIVRRYNLPANEKGIQYFFHIDLYRAEGEASAAELGLEEIMHAPSAIVAVEWAEKLPKSLRVNLVTIHMTYNNETTRTIDISSPPASKT